MFQKKNIYQTIKENNILRLIFWPAISLRRKVLSRISKNQEKVIDSLNDILVNDPIIKVSEFTGEFSLSSKSDLFKRVVLNNSYEPELVNLCKELIPRDKDIVDVGANIGFYSIFFAQLFTEGTNKVVAVEPTQAALKHLKKNITLNNVEDRVQIFEGVLSNSSKSISINSIEGKEEYSSIFAQVHPSIKGEDSKTETVSSKTLDELVESYSIDPGFIKIDVEGAEHLVLQGAQNTLKVLQPIIMAELSDYLLKRNGSSAQEVIDLIKSYGYDIFDPINGLEERIKQTKEFGDIICIPKKQKTDLIT